MPENFFPLLIGLATGIHAGSYGAYKDSPYEGFKPLRVYRELFIAGILGYLFSVYQWARGEKFFIVFLVIFALSRLITEFYKLFIRTESQSLYKIPTQIHLFGRLVTGRRERLLLGLLPVVILLCIYAFGELGLNGFPKLMKGLILGLQMGLGTAIAGGYKDGFFEGFDKTKFMRSPVLGAIGGMLISLSTTNTLFIILGAVGFERIVVELYKAFLKRGYWPGKFGSGKVHHKEWLKMRKIFVPLYFITLLFFLYLLISGI